jgi:hypothetical protein
VVSRDLEVVLHGFDVIFVVNDHVLDRIKVDGQGALVVSLCSSQYFVSLCSSQYFVSLCSSQYFVSLCSSQY